MRRLILAFALVLTGCSQTPTIITETKYHVRTAPADIREMPVREPSADAQINTDNEAAGFLIGTEAYIERLEKKIKELITFYERPVK